MNSFNYAIASIVDANTHYLHRSGAIDYNTAMRHGREIRGKSVVASLKSLGRSLRSAYRNYLDHRAERREVSRLLQLNDTLLRDVGLSRDELYAVHYGITTLADLQARRAAHLEAEVRDQVKPSTKVRIEREHNAANEAVFESAKCA
jgi:uncharacterized protein YjiS (DUF1127 family)